MVTAADDDALDRGHIAVIAAPGERDVLERGNLVVCRIDVNPAVVRRIGREPGVRRVGPDEPRLAGRRTRYEIAAHITGRQSERTKAADLQMREILANAAT